MIKELTSVFKSICNSVFKTVLKTVLKTKGRRLIAIALGFLLTFITLTPSVEAALIGSGQKVKTNREILEEANAGITGNYVEDTKAVVNSLRYAIELDPKDPNKTAAQTDARFKINSYASRYRRDTEKLGLTSFTTLRTALNALASYYNGTTKRSVPPKVRDRVILELDRVDQALAQGR